MNKSWQICALSETLQFLIEKGFSEPTEIQKLAICEIKKGGNFEFFSPTGSGKTLAYLIPLCEKFKIAEKNNELKKMGSGPSIVVLSPTRELAEQITQDARSLSHHLKLKVRKIDGPKDWTTLGKKGCDLLVGVTGNVLSAIKKGNLSLANTFALVVDEADQMLEGGFKKDLVEIKKQIRNEKAQVILMSATEGLLFVPLRSEIFGNIPFHKIAVEINHLLPQIETFNIFLGVKEKMPMAKEFIKKEAKGQGIIFINKKEEIEEIFNQLKESFPSKRMFFIHGGMSPKERDVAYNSFLNDGEILVASDIMARGIDLKNAAWVLNYDLPFEAIYYIHRSGRVGRGGKKGQVYNMVTSNDSEIISRINESIKGQTALKLTTIKDPFKAQKEKQMKFKAKQEQGIIAIKKERRSGAKGSFKSTPRYARIKNKSKKKGKG